jgi:hypothetical protein
MKTSEGAVHVTGVYSIRMSPKGLAFKKKKKECGIVMHLLCVLLLVEMVAAMGVKPFQVG